MTYSLAMCVQCWILFLLRTTVFLRTRPHCYSSMVRCISALHVRFVCDIPGVMLFQSDPLSRHYLMVCTEASLVYKSILIYIIAIGDSYLLTMTVHWVSWTVELMLFSNISGPLIWQFTVWESCRDRQEKEWVRFLKITTFHINSFSTFAFIERLFIKKSMKIAIRNAFL